MDGRSLPVLFDPEAVTETKIEVKKRGAYYAVADVLSLRDAFGFFVAKTNIPAEDGPRLLALPEATPFIFAPEPKAGGDAFRHEPKFTKTDELTESRRYLPGDDPRRINWKVYGHSGELFVREGEPEPPPRSQYAVLVDSSIDEESYSDENTEVSVDSLAEIALGLVSELLRAGLDVEYGALGLPLSSGNEKSASVYFSKISKHTTKSAPDLPVPDDMRIRTVVFALPRLIDHTKKTALDRFLENRSTSSGPVELLFLEQRGSIETGEPRSAWERAFLRDPSVRRSKGRASEAPKASSEECVGFYQAKGGVRVRRLEV
ncbi:MAG: DUF58 domain-containing protein [Treponemataceae bacterium]